MGERKIIIRDVVADGLSKLLNDPKIAKLVVDNPNHPNSKLLIRANAISVNSDLLETQQIEVNETPQ